MGIPGLLEHLKSVIARSHISAFSGKSAAVDAHCWLHRGAFACSKDLVLGNPTEKYITFFMSMVNLLKQNGITSILVVFDGLSLPNKSETNRKRSDDRKKNIGLAREADACGDQKLAMTYYQRGVSVTFDMIKKLLVVLKKEGVSYMISPYESDAQLAFLSKNNIVDLVITEDSDSIPYGCQTVMFKMDREGYGDLFEQNKLHTNQTLSFANWTDDQFKLFCCLSGCDYMPGLRNFGLKTAYKVVHKYKTLSKVLEHLSFSNSITVYDGCLGTRLEQALLTLKHQTVFNPFTGCTEPLSPLPLTFSYLDSSHSNYTNSAHTSSATDSVRSTTSRNALTTNTAQSDLAFLGPLLDPTTALQLAKGKIDPQTIKQVEDSGSVSDNSSVKPQHVADQAFTASRNESTTTTVQHIHASTSSCTPPRQQQGTGIKWFSSEDRALHTARARTQHSSTSDGHASVLNDTALSVRAYVPTHHSTTATTTHHSNTASRKRGRPSAQQAQTNPLPQAQHSTLTCISTAGAMHATSSYHSDLISDTLVPLHRRTRLRSVEPNYSTTHTYNSRSSANTMDNYVSAEPQEDENMDVSISKEYVDNDVWDTIGDQTDTWDHDAFPTVYHNTTTPARRPGTFFKDASTPSPIITHYPPGSFSPVLDTSTYDMGAECESSCVDDDYLYRTEINYPPDDTYGEHADSSITDDLGVIGSDSMVKDAQRELKQFQDDDFDRRLAYQYALHPVSMSSERSSNECRVGVTYVPVIDAIGSSAYDSAVNSINVGRERLNTSTSTTIPPRPSVYPINATSSRVPTAATAPPYSQLPTTTSYYRPNDTYDYNTYSNPRSLDPTTTYSHYTSSHLPPYTASVHTDHPIYTYVPSSGTQFLHNVSVLDESWKHQQFPGLLHS